MKDDMLIDINGVAEIFNMSVENIRKYIGMGYIKAYKSEGRKNFYDKADIVERKRLIVKHLSENKPLKELRPIIEQYEKMQQAYISVPKGRKKVLIVDDQEAMCRILSRILYHYFGEDQLAIFTTIDGRSAIQIAAKLIPDLIILDIVMDANDFLGTEIYDRLKRQLPLKYTKYIFISGAVKPEPPLDGICFLGKPIPSDDLVKTVSEIVGIEPEPSRKKKSFNLCSGR